MSDIDTSLIPDFVAEAIEHLEEMEAGLLKIEADPANVDLLNGIFRNIHTIKGAAQFIGLKQTSHLSHSAENLLDLLRSGDRVCTPSVVDILIQVKDRLGQLMREIERTQDEQILVDDLVAAISAHIEKPSTALAPPAKIEPQQFTEETPVVQETESYQEEMDQELFTIFSSQLIEEIVKVRDQLEQAKISATPGPLILDCINGLEKLKSSANYMGYEGLINIYEAWIRSLYVCLTNDVPDWKDIDQYFEQVAQRFPQFASKIVKPKPDQPPLLQLPPSPPAIFKQEVAAIAPIIKPEPKPKPASEALLTKLSTALQQTVSSAPTSKTSELEEIFEELTNIYDTNNVAVDITKSVAAPAEEMILDDSIEDQMNEILPPSAQKQDTTTGAKEQKPGNERTLKRSVRVDAEKIDMLMNQVGELIVHRSYFNQIHNDLISIQRHLEALGIDPHQAKALRTLSYRYSEAIVALSRTANELQEGVMKVRMLPIAQLFNRYPRLVHDLIRHSDKKVRLEMRGEDTELDKMIIEEVSDPLIHIIRNAIDHGFETATERKRLGKPEVGTLILDAYHESNHIVIKVMDDGRGIDHRKVGAKAVEKGIITEVELDRMTPREIIRLIMQPGFSTAEAITNTSGRGVGMDVVRKNIEKLNGTVEIDSEVGSGSRFRFKIPLTLAIISALQVRVGDTYFTIPLANVEETLRVFQKDTSVIESIEVIQLRGHTMPIFRLASLFNIRGDNRNGGRMFVVVVNTGSEKVGLVVDALLGQDEVVIKPLIDYLQEKSGFSGATIIGGGRISLILDVYELVKMTAYKQARMQHQFAVRRRQMAQNYATIN